MRDIAIYYNDEYSRSKNFSSRLRSLQALYDRVSTLTGKSVLLKPLCFVGDTIADVRGNIVKQLASDIDKDRDMRRITFFGDGGTGVFLHSREQITREKKQEQYPVFIAPGGTMNLLSGHLNKQQNKALFRYLRAFDSEQDKMCVNIRNLALIREKKSKDVYSEEYPWICFAGAGMDAYLLNVFESLPRNHSVPRKVAQTAKTVFSDVILHNHELSCHGAVALSSWGIIKFPESFTTLDKDYFHAVTLKPRKGLEVVRDTLACHIAGLHPQVLHSLWQEVLPTKTGIDLIDQMVGAAYDMRPQSATEWRTPIPTIKNKVYFHVDGFPMQSSVSADERGSLQFSTAKSRPVSVFNFVAL